MVFRVSLKLALIQVATLASLCQGCQREARSAADDHWARERAAQELADATAVLEEMREIPPEVRRRTGCVMVIPSLIRAGLFVGARHGDGVVTCRVGTAWSAPLFLTVLGGSAGMQIGIEASDVVMLIMSPRGMARLLRSSFVLGGDASASAGPVGSAVQAGTDGNMSSEILSYARSRGFFAGAELSGSVVQQDQEALPAMYGPDADVPGILGGNIAAPKEAATFLSRVQATFPAVPLDAGANRLRVAELVRSWTDK
jgi:SH3 domain-containing YSC84-like protein 1